MGKVSIDSESSITHFCHAHPLKLLNHQSLQTLTHVSCSGCNLETSESIYGCTPCNYFLHKKCSEMPKQITHPFDQHVFTLLSKPKYPEGVFNCDGCGKQGKGFCYHCETCGKDLHILCASLPELLTHQSHHHRLSLIFSPPYSNKKFHCHLCNNPGSNHWLYRCNLCAFDVHLSCVKNISGATRSTIPTSVINVPAPAQVIGMPFASRPQIINFVPQNTNPGAYGTSGTAFAQHQAFTQQYTSAMQQAFAQQQSFAQQQAIVQQQAAMQQRQAMMQQQAMLAQQQAMMQQQGLGQQQPGNMIMNSLVQGLAGGVAQGATEALIQGLFGGGGNGGNDASAYDGSYGGDGSYY